MGLTEAEREALGLIVIRADNDDLSIGEWHPCEGCAGGPCACSGRPWLGAEMTDAINAILAAHDAATRADERALVLGEVERRLNLLDARINGLGAAHSIIRDMRGEGGA